MAVKEGEANRVLDLRVKEEPASLQAFSDNDDEDEDQLAISQLIRKTHAQQPSPMVNIKKRKLLETRNKKQEFADQKGPPDSTHVAKKVTLTAEAHRDGCKRKREKNKYSSDHLKGKSSVMERAEELQANLSPEFPSFILTMLPSHVSRGFCLTIPRHFCCMHLPKDDAIVFLVDENGKEYRINYLAKRGFLSGGWKAFCDAKKLVEGDVLVYQLLRPLKLKVYIVRANDSAEIDAALGLLKLYGQRTQHAPENTGRKHPKPLHRDNRQGNRPRISLVASNSDSKPNDEKGVGLPSGSACYLQELRGANKFRILVNGTHIDSELSEQIKAKYYELCRSQDCYLHENLLENISSKLAAEIITTTVNIADAIRACKVSTPQAEYAMLLDTLNGFEQLGMEVGFLRDRLGRLVSLSFESKLGLKHKRYRDLKLKQALVKERTRNLVL